ncbi:MAG TPA: O-antigen ligase family protein [Rhodanobacteraceae bacterium]|nr:O-antigen ligase family protein [Rhodanobacteraceae bacterium]
MLFILIYIVLVIVRPQEYPGVAEMQLPILPIALVLALLAWLIAGRKNFAEPQFPLIGAFLLVMMFSQVVNGWSGGALQQFIQFGPAVAAFVIIANTATTQRRVMVVMAVFVLCSCVLAVHGVEQKAAGIGWTGMPLVQDGRIQYVGIFSDPNDLGLLFVAVLPMALYLSSRGGLLGLLRLFWLAAAALLLYGIYLTNSRGALLAVGALLGAWLWQKRGLVTAVVIGGAGLAGMMMLPSRLQELDASESSAAGRVDAWYEGIQMFVSQPLFGVGAGNFTEHNYLTAHNSFVLALAETGFIGFAIWLAFVGYCFRMMLVLYRHKPELADAAATASWTTERALALTLLMSLVGFFTAAFFLSRTYVIILYFIAALVVAEYAGASRRFAGLPVFRLTQDAGRWFVIAAGGVVALFVITRVLL